jgi:hypothetical protein
VRVPAPPTTEDYRLATASLQAVQSFVAAHKDLFEGPPQRGVTMSSRIRMAAGDVEITIDAPPHDVPWRWGEEEPFEGLLRQERDEILTAFRAAREAEGAPLEALEPEHWAASEMLEFKQRIEESFVDWGPEEISEFLLEYYPARGGETGEAVRTLPERFDAFLRWLAASGRGSPGRLAAARARLSECRTRFLERASDVRLFGPAKRVAAAMTAAGVDMSDDQAVEAFMADFNRRLAEDPTLLGDVGLPRMRWTWDGQGPAPERDAPCPCGSGRRYRKCCMPR